MYTKSLALDIYILNRNYTLKQTIKLCNEILSIHENEPQRRSKYINKPLPDNYKYVPDLLNNLGVPKLSFYHDCHTSFEIWQNLTKGDTIQTLKIPRKVFYMKNDPDQDYTYYIIKHYWVTK